MRILCRFPVFLGSFLFVLAALGDSPSSVASLLQRAVYFRRFRFMLNQAGVGNLEEIRERFRVSCCKKTIADRLFAVFRKLSACRT